MCNSRKQKGIGLIEIMVALVVVAIGILGIAQLQTKVVRNASDANARAIAAVIAQKKIDELRSFNFLSTFNPDYGAGDFAFEEIADEGPITVSDALSNTEFQLTTSIVGDYYYGVTDLTQATKTGTGIPDFKVVEVQVNWIDIDSSTQNYTVRTVIDGYPPQFSSLKGNSTIGSNPPIIPYTPEAAPDVVPVTLDVGDKKRESSKPEPDVSKKGDSTTVRFETVTYDNLDVSLNVADTIKREEFLTTKCRCGSGTPTNEILKGKTVWDEELMEIVDVAASEAVPTINKTAVDNSVGGEVQALECSICCQNGADALNGSPFKACRLKRIDGVMRIVDEWKLIALNIIPASFFNSENANSENSISGMSTSLAERNISLYSDYVSDIVRDALAEIDPNTSSFSSQATREANLYSIIPDTDFAAYINDDLNDVDNFVNAGPLDHKSFERETQGDITSILLGNLNVAKKNRQIQVRAVYMDLPPTGIYSSASGAYDTLNVPLDRVAFYENNFTQIAGWVPDVNIEKNGSTTGDESFDDNYTEHHDDLDGGCENDDGPSTARNFVSNEEFYEGGGTFTDCSDFASRGMFYPAGVASTAVQTIMFTGNEGIVDFKISTSASTAIDTLTLEVLP